MDGLGLFLSGKFSGDVGNMGEIMNKCDTFFMRVIISGHSAVQF